MHIFVKSFTVLALASLAVCLQDTTKIYNGTAVFYNGPQDQTDYEYVPRIPAGACGYGDMDPREYPFWSVVTINTANPIFNNTQLGGCGQCLEVTCVDEQACLRVGKKSIVATVTDHNPAMGLNDLSLHAFAFQEIASTFYGHANVSWRLVNCQPIDGVKVIVHNYRVQDGGWLRLAMAGVACSANIQQVQIRPHGNNTIILPNGRKQTGYLWRAMENTYGAVWEYNGVPHPPLDLKIILDTSEELEMPNAIQAEGQTGTMFTSANFRCPDNSNGVA